MQQLLETIMTVQENISYMVNSCVSTTLDITAVMNILQKIFCMSICGKQ